MPKAPRFWRERNILSETLVPLSVFWYLARRIAEKKASTTSFDVPILCVGNGIAGGAGKTPTVISLIHVLKKITKKRITVVSRGYGGKNHIPVRVDVKTHKYTDVGDEPLLIAKHADCWIGANRKATIKEAIKSGAELIILDDGMQDYTIKKDFTFMVVDGRIGFGNGLLMPAGPLRDRMDKLYATCDACLQIAEGELDIADDKPLYHASITPQLELDTSLSYIAFAGIGYPEKFFQTLHEMGVTLVEVYPFSDHHHYKAEELDTLKARKELNNATLITTEKDAVKIGDALDDLVTLPITLTFHEEDTLQKMLKKRLAL